MCGIIGLYNFPSQKVIIKKGLKIMQNRGSDNSSIFEKDKIIFGHNLHSIVNYLTQPIISKNGALVINCEIYNWKELNEKYSLSAKNDAELVLLLIEKNGINKIKEIIEELDGDFAFAYYSYNGQKIILARDLAGVKPLVFMFNEKDNSFAFSSEKKALPFDSIHLNPRKIALFDIKESSLDFIDLEIKKSTIENNNSLFVMGNLMVDAVMNRVPEKDFGVLLSGGVDSTIIAKILADVGRPFVGVFSYVKDIGEAKDLIFAKEVSNGLDIKLIESAVNLKEYEKELPKIISLIESTDPIRVGVASTIYFATKELSKKSPNTKVIFSGLGADELFAGYDRFKKSTNINKDCYSYFIKLYENDLYYQDIVSMYNKLELRVPFLDKTLVQFALSLDSKQKIDNDKGINKKILRELAVSIRIPESIAFRPKKAAQYGSNFDKALEVLTKENKFKSKAEYLNSIGSSSMTKNIPIAALLSTGKDSIFAMNLMQKQGYVVKCLITIESKNPDSFMFHTPTVKLAKLQSKSLGLPLIMVKTTGKKEKEIIDLEKAIKSAKKKFKIEGIVSGALYSNYQRERIEKVCENLGIRAFAPLWQIDQVSYLQNLIKNGYLAVITKIAAYGFDEKWLGKIIDADSIKELEKLQSKFKINPAGEGGEYESLVLDAPSFNKKIDIVFKKKMQNEFTGDLVISSAKLVKK